MNRSNAYRAKAFELLSLAESVNDLERRADLLRFARHWMSLSEPMPNLPSASYEFPRAEAAHHVDFPAHLGHRDLRAGGRHWGAGGPVSAALGKRRRSEQDAGGQQRGSECRISGHLRSLPPRAD